MPEVTGYDATLRLYGLVRPLRSWRTPLTLWSREVFGSFSASNVATAGETALVTSHALQQNLPPSAVAARFHSLRVYLQVKQWQGEDSSITKGDWGWKFDGTGIIPVTSDLPSAPESRIAILRGVPVGGMACSVPSLWLGQGFSLHK